MQGRSAGLGLGRRLRLLCDPPDIINAAFQFCLAMVLLLLATSVMQLSEETWAELPASLLMLSNVAIALLASFGVCVVTARWLAARARLAPVARFPLGAAMLAGLLALIIWT